MSTRDDGWFDALWQSMPQIDEDKGILLARLFAEMLDEGVVRRDGDSLLGRSGQHIELTSEDQYLVRRIEDAVAAASEEAPMSEPIKVTFSDPDSGEVLAETTVALWGGSGVWARYQGEGEMDEALCDACDGTGWARRG